MHDAPRTKQPDSSKKSTWDIYMAHLGDEDALQDAAIDPGIRETICALNVLGIHTVASNEGNEGPSRNNGDTPYPWILFTPEEADNSTAYADPENNRAPAEAQRRRVELLLDRFYINRGVDKDVRLRATPVLYGQFLVLNTSDEMNEKVTLGTTTNEEVADMLAKLPARKKEMQDFGTFLKDLFFSGEITS